MKVARKIPEPVSQQSKDPQQSAGRNEFRLFTVAGSPYLQVRLMVAGKRRQFSTGETSERAAKAKARAILADIKSRGFAEAISLHSRKDDVVDANPTIEQLSDLYRKVSKSFESPPSAATLRVYTNNLKSIAEYCGAKRLNRLTTDTIEQAKRKFLAHSAAGNRNPTAARVTLASLIRNASAVFSKQALAAFRAHGLSIENPFIDSKVKGIKIKTYSLLPQQVLDSIWSSASLLRDGNPEAPPPDESVNLKKRFDFRRPHPDAYAILFLELGLGLRRNEADKAEWSWCNQTRDGRRFIEVRESEVFKPKSKHSRVIPIADDVWEALESIRSETARFIVPAETARKRKSPPSSSYRCDSGHRILVEWLRGMGVTSAKPCHALRKEFGSYVATSFSLFHAQKLLGHSSPTVTSDYYAGLTGLPILNPIGKAT
jgi:integrase